MENKEVQLISPEELSLVDGSALNGNQLKFLLKKTPAQYLRKRPAKGGGQWDYVSGGYVKKMLNLMFGFDWDFEILEQLILHGEAIVKGRLTCRTNGKIIVKTQFGNKDIIYKKQSEADAKLNLEKIPLSIGNDLKAAATDCLKKCAAEIGIAADIYNKEEFREIQVDTTTGIKQGSKRWQQAVEAFNKGDVSIEELIERGLSKNDVEQLKNEAKAL